MKRLQLIFLLIRPENEDSSGLNWFYRFINRMCQVRQSYKSYVRFTYMRIKIPNNRAVKLQLSAKVPRWTYKRVNNIQLNWYPSESRSLSHQLHVRPTLLYQIFAMVIPKLISIQHCEAFRKSSLWNTFIRYEINFYSEIFWILFLWRSIVELKSIIKHRCFTDFLL